MNDEQPQTGAPGTTGAPRTLEGWYALHEVRRIRWDALKQLDPERRKALAAEATTFFEAVAAMDEGASDDGAAGQGAGAARQGASALYSVIGHKGDLLSVHLRPDLSDLAALERRLAGTALADVSEAVYSYVSVTELSLYGAPDPDRDFSQDPFARRRLYPEIPRGRYVSFYPMSKKRDGDDNWYMLDYGRRRELMRAHSLIGRTYADRVTQMITSSVGLDDWEWGVTLWSDDAVNFKKVVYEMRFDEASARYGLFGPFYVGMRLEPTNLVRFLEG